MLLLAAFSTLIRTPCAKTVLLATSNDIQTVGFITGHIKKSDLLKSKKAVANATIIALETFASQHGLFVQMGYALRGPNQIEFYIPLSGCKQKAAFRTRLVKCHWSVVAKFWHIDVRRRCSISFALCNPVTMYIAVRHSLPAIVNSILSLVFTFYLCYMRQNYCKMMRHAVRYKLSKEFAPSYVDSTRISIGLKEELPGDTDLINSFSFKILKYFRLICEYLFWEEGVTTQYDALVTNSLQEDTTNDEQHMHKNNPINALQIFSFFGRVFHIPVKVIKGANDDSDIEEEKEELEQDFGQVENPDVNVYFDPRQLKLYNRDRSWKATAATAKQAASALRRHEQSPLTNQEDPFQIQQVRHISASIDQNQIQRTITVKRLR